MVVPAVAQAPSVQSLVMKVTPTKLEKKKFKPVTLFVDVITDNNDEDTTFTQPPSADRTQVDFSKNMKFDSGRRADSARSPRRGLQNTTTDAAKSALWQQARSSASLVPARRRPTVIVDTNPNVQR